MEKNDLTWEKNTRPDLTVCPKHFCFFWHEKGDWVAKGIYANVEEAMGNMVKVDKSQCGFHYGCCTREKQVEGAKDYYEPCEPALAQVDLPAFFFNNPAWNKSAEDRNAYNAYFGIKDQPEDK